MSGLSPAVSATQPSLAGIAETTGALRSALERTSTDLQAVERNLIATGAEFEFVLWEPIRQTERRFVGPENTCAADSAWCLCFCRTEPDQGWRLVIREYYREYEPIGTQAPIRIIRAEMPVVTCSAELQLAAMDYLVSFLEAYHDALRQTLALAQAQAAASLQRPVSRPRTVARSAS